MPHSYCDILTLLNLCWPINQDRTTMAVARPPATRTWISNGRYRAKYESGIVALTLKIRRATRAGNSLSLFCVTVRVNQRRASIHAAFTHVRKKCDGFALSAKKR